MGKKRLRTLRGLLWLAAVAAVVGVPSAATGTATAEPILYVDRSNPACSDSASGSAEQPYCTIGAAAGEVAAGQTVQVAAGTYSEEVDVPTSGTSTALIVFNGAPGATVTGGEHGFLISGRSWITVGGFIVTGTSSDGIHVNASSRITLSGNTVRSSGEPTSSDKSSGIVLDDVDDAVVSGNTVDHNTDSGIVLEGGSTRNQVKGNYVFENARGYERAAAGIRLYSAPSNTIAGNVSHDNEDSGIECYTGSKNNLLYNNVTYDNGDHGIDNYKSTGNRVIANSVYRNVTAGINVEGSSTGATIANNVSVDNGIDSPRTKGNLRVDSGSKTGSTMNYDLVYLTRAATLLVWGSTSYTSMSSFRTATGQEAKGIEADPKWKSPATGDFHLTAGSKAIDSANSDASGQPTADVEGKARVDDPATPNTGAGTRTYDDRGAYEFQPSGIPNQPPNAALTVTPASGRINLAVTADASASNDPEGAIASYTFNFGDGTPLVGPQSGATAAHTYTVPGTYTVTVTVKDAGGLSATATTQVVVRNDPPTAALTVTPASGPINLSVTADASASTDTDAAPIATYTFNFGDGTPLVGPQPGATAPHTYTVPGTYTVIVTVTDTLGAASTATKQVVVRNDPPAARLTVTPGSGTAPLDVTADASASTDTDAAPIESYTFDFGDGTPVVGPQAVATAPHTYGAAGTYTVTVTVKDTLGASSTATATVRATVAGQSPPTAALTVTPPSGAAPLSVSADGSASTDPEGPIASYAFAWGDGTPATGPQSAATASHTYATGGTYTVTLTVTDGEGLSSTTTAQVVVMANLVGNPGFETDTAGWNNSSSGTGVTFARVAGGHSGGWAAKLTNTGTAAATCHLNDSPNWVRTTSAGMYTASIWVRGDTAGATLKLKLREYTGSTLNGSATTLATLTTSWQLVTVTYAPVAPGSSLDFSAHTPDAPPGTCFYADDAAVYLE